MDHGWTRSTGRRPTCGLARTGLRRLVETLAVKDCMLHTRKASNVDRFRFPPKASNGVELAGGGAVSGS